MYRPDLPLFQVPVINLRNFSVEASLFTESKCHPNNSIGKWPKRKTTKFKGKKHRMFLRTYINLNRL